jgi:hypothetical protein
MKIAEFVGNTSFSGRNATKHWGIWMREVEPRIREQDLWGVYCWKLWEIVDGSNFPIPSRVAEKIMSATLEQRASALERVLEERE